MQVRNKITLFINNPIFFLSIFWISGYFFFPSGKIHDQTFILIFTIPALWLLAKKEISLKPFLTSKVFCLALAYCLYWIISTFWGTYQNYETHLSAIKSALYIYLFWVVIFSTYYLNESRLELLFKCIIFCSVINVFVNLLIFYGLDHAILSDRFNGFGRLRNQLWVAAIYGSMAILMLSLTVQPNSKNKTLYFILFLLFLVATILTHSRTPIISMLAVSLFLFFSSQLSYKTKLQFSFISLSILTLSYIFFSKYYLADISRGQSYRLDLWIGFLAFIKNHLLFGNGADTNVFISMPGSLVDGWSHYHNVYLGSLVELGLLGLGLHLILIIYTIIIGWRYRKTPHINTSLMIFIFTCLIGITYGQGIVTNKNVQWIIFWLPLSVIIMHELEMSGLSNPTTRSIKC